MLGGNLLIALPEICVHSMLFREFELKMFQFFHYLKGSIFFFIFFNLDLSVAHYNNGASGNGFHAFVQFLISFGNSLFLLYRQPFEFEDNFKLSIPRDDPYNEGLRLKINVTHNVAISGLHNSKN